MSLVAAHRPEAVAEAAEAVGGKRSERERQEGGAERGDDAVPEAPEELGAHRRGLEDGVGREAERAPPPPVRLEIIEGQQVPELDVHGHLHRRGDGPVDREEADEGPEDQARRRSAPGRSHGGTLPPCGGGCRFAPRNDGRGVVWRHTRPPPFRPLRGHLPHKGGRLDLRWLARGHWIACVSRVKRLLAFRRIVSTTMMMTR